MKSEIIKVTNRGEGQQAALDETTKIAEACGLTGKDVLVTRLIAEEMMSLVRSIAGELFADYSVECEGTAFCYHLTTAIVMDAERRAMLIQASSSRTNDAAKGFLGKLREVIEKAMVMPAPYPMDSYIYAFDASVSNVPFADLPNHPVVDEDWDRYEQSILKRVADDIKVAIRGKHVELTISKKF